ncbi:carboxypeptidase inhibitor SmCI-like [Haemaphysalis longicornis]
MKLLPFICFLTCVEWAVLTSKLPKDCKIIPREDPCRAEFTTWFYNITSRSCELLRGCYMTKVFGSLLECNKKCRNRDYKGCAAIKFKGPCPQQKLKKGIWFDPDLRKCVKFENEKCQNYRKVFFTEEQCYTECAEFVQDRCLLPMKPATATCPYDETPVTRFGYNQSTGQCVEFLYLSCGGNRNAFVSRADCLNTCNPHSTCLKNTQENDEWYRTFKSFYYNKTNDECRLTKTFVSKAMWPRENRFATKNKCDEVCRPTYKPVHRGHIPQI